MDPIIERIKKLLALSRNNPNPHEAEAAAALANRLMLKHSIDASKVEGGPQERSSYTRQVFTTGKFASWESQLLSWIARANLCKIIKIGRDTWDVLGPADNVAVTVEMQVWLRTEIHRLAVEAYATHDERSNYGSMDPHRFHTSFKHGAVAAIGSRLMESFQEVKKESASNESALAVIANKLEVFTSEVYPKLRTVRSKAGCNSDGDAYGAGRKAGSKVALRPTKVLP